MCGPRQQWRLALPGCSAATLAAAPCHAAVADAAAARQAAPRGRHWVLPASRQRGGGYGAPGAVDVVQVERPLGLGPGCLGLVSSITATPIPLWCGPSKGTADL